MTAPLGEGPSAIVPVKAPEELREALKKCLHDGETVSGLTRQLWEREIKKREKKKTKRQLRLEGK